jgi:hypothetical protein
MSGILWGLSAALLAVVAVIVGAETYIGLSDWCHRRNPNRSRKEAPK